MSPSILRDSHQSHTVGKRRGRSVRMTFEHNTDSDEGTVTVQVLASELEELSLRPNHALGVDSDSPHDDTFLAAVTISGPEADQRAAVNSAARDSLLQVFRDGGIEEGYLQRTLRTHKGVPLDEAWARSLDEWIGKKNLILRRPSSVTRKAWRG